LPTIRSPTRDKPLPNGRTTARGVHARIEPQQAGAAAHLAGFVEIAGERLLLDAGGIARRREPALVHVDALELKMRLVERHGRNPVQDCGMVAAWAAKVKIV
jgi:hypothetical protein